MRLHLVPGRQPPDLLELPWTIPLEQWESARLVRMARGNSRHVVRFVGDGERVYALKEMAPALTEHEYSALRRMALERLPVVEAVGLVSGRETEAGEPLDAVLVTRYLDFSLPYRYLFGVEGGRRSGAPPAGRGGRPARAPPPRRLVVGRLLAQQPAVPARRRGEPDPEVRGGRLVGGERSCP